MSGDRQQTATWQTVRVTGIGVGELWFDGVAEDLTQSKAERRARQEEDLIAIPMLDEMPDDWGEQWLAGELESDPYAQ